MSLAHTPRPTVDTKIHRCSGPLSKMGQHGAYSLLSVPENSRPWTENTVFAPWLAESTVPDCGYKNGRPSICWKKSTWKWTRAVQCCLRGRCNKAAINPKRGEKIINFTLVKQLAILMMYISLDLA